MSVTSIDCDNPGCIGMFASMSKTLYSHSFSRFSCGMKTRREQPREGCLFSAISFPEEIALRHQRIFFLLLTQ